MGIWDKIKDRLKQKEEIYNPQREAIDRRHDALQRQISYYEKKRQIPLMEQRVHDYEKHVYGNTMHTRDENNILKVPNYFKGQQVRQQRRVQRRGMI